jgi:hypothetical protein
MHCIVSMSAQSAANMNKAGGIGSLKLSPWLPADQVRCGQPAAADAAAAGQLGRRGGAAGAHRGAVCERPPAARSRLAPCRRLGLPPRAFPLPSASHSHATAFDLPRSLSNSGHH